MWMKKRIPFKFKRKIYCHVFLKMVSYTTEVWFDVVGDVQSQIKRLNRIQRMVKMAITDGYRTTANEKLLRLLRLSRLDKELMIKNDVAELNRANRPEVSESMSRAQPDEKSNG